MNASDFSMYTKGTTSFEWMNDGITSEAVNGDVAKFVREYAKQTISNWAVMHDVKASDNTIYKTWRSGNEFAELCDYVQDILAKQTLEQLQDILAKRALGKLLDGVEGVYGIESPYGSNDYTITIWDDMEGGYDVVYTRNNTDIAHSRENHTRESALQRMIEFNNNPQQWVSVEFGS